MSDSCITLHHQEGRLDDRLFQQRVAGEKVSVERSWLNSNAL
jgi:hypothetical protein